MYMNLSEYYNQIGDVLLNADKDYANATSYTDVLPKSSMLSPYQPTGMSVVTGGTRPNYKALPGEFTDTHFDNKWVTDPKGAGAPEGGKVNRLKKAQRWSGFAKDTVGDGFEIYDKVQDRTPMGKAENYAAKAVGLGCKKKPSACLLRGVEALKGGKKPTAPQMKKLLEAGVLKTGGATPKAKVPKAVKPAEVDVEGGGPKWHKPGGGSWASEVKAAHAELKKKNPTAKLKEALQLASARRKAKK